MAKGFFDKKEVEIDLTFIPGKKELLKPKAPKKVYGCNDCLRCSKGQIKVKDEELSTDDKIVYKMVGCNAPDPIEPEGLGQKRILIVVDELTEYAQVSKSPIVGNERKLLEKAVSEVGLDLYRDCWVVSSIRGKKRSGSKGNAGFERKACSQVLLEDIQRLQPKVVITTGFSALSTLIGDKTPVTDEWEKFEGETIPDQDLKTTICVTYNMRDMIWLLKERREKYISWGQQSGHPNTQALNPKIEIIDNDKLKTDLYKLKWDRIIRLMKKIPIILEEEFPIDTTAQDVEVLHTKKEIIESLYFFLQQKHVTVDIEANSLKGYRKEARILCIGISTLHKSVGFMTYDSDIIKLCIELIGSNKVLKTCHNNPYEWQMFRNVWNVEMEHIAYDSMLLVHTMDHRKHVCSLKHQVYVKFGQKGYDSKTKPFFNMLSDIDKGTRYYDKKNDQRINGLEEALQRGALYDKGLLFPIPIPEEISKDDIKKIKKENKLREKLYKMGWLTEEEILFYVASDAHYTAKLVNYILPRLTKKEKEASVFFTQGALALSHMTQHGVYVNKAVLDREITNINIEMAKLDSLIFETEEVKMWDGEDKFNPGSGPQLAHLLFDILKNPIISKTDAGKPATDKVVLEKLGTPLCKLMLQKNKLSKVKSTYMDGWARGMDDKGLCHPEFLLFSTTSYRSSSSGPNAQNSPKRDKKMKKLSRMFLEPRPGQILCEYDYSGAETFSAACITKCPTMTKYMLDPTTCMHSDTACFLLRIQDKTNLPSYTKIVDGKEVLIEAPEETFAILRQTIKSFVFGQFYGDYFGNQVKTLWEDFGQLEPNILEWLELHMIAVGLADTVAFTNRLEEAEKDMWNRFKVYKQWKEDSWKDYVEKGYAETVTGFRLTSLLDRKQISNLKIQGPSFHHLLHGIILVDKEFRRLKLKSTFGAQVHDSFVTSTVPEEREIVDKIVTECFLTKAEQLPNLSWVEIPFVMDRDVYTGSWASDKDKEASGRLDPSLYTTNYITA